MAFCFIVSFHEQIFFPCNAEWGQSSISSSGKHSTHSPSDFFLRSWMNPSFLCYSQQFSRVPWSMIKYISIIFLIKVCLLYLSLWPNWNWFLCGIRSGTSFVIFHMDSRMPLLSYIKAPRLVTVLIAVLKCMAKSNLRDERFVLAHRLGMQFILWAGGCLLTSHGSGNKKREWQHSVGFFLPSFRTLAIDSATPVRDGSSLLS